MNIYIRCPECGVNFFDAEKFHLHKCSPIVASPLEKGIKHDAEKPRMDLLSTHWVEGVAKVLAFGARKYQADNWRKGIERRRLLGSSLRHIFAYLGGEDFDPETGMLHLWHASCGLMFASELHFTRPDTDDRYKS